MPEVWEQKGSPAGPCFCGDIQEELKDSEELWSSAAGSDRMDRQHTEAARTTTGAAASAGATAATAITIRCKPDMLFISRNVPLLTIGRAPGRNLV